MQTSPSKITVSGASLVIADEGRDSAGMVAACAAQELDLRLKEERDGDLRTRVQFGLNLNQGRS